MTPVMEELDRLIAAASIPEIARAVEFEGRYQASGTTVSRATWYETVVLAWWPRLSPCRFCSAQRVHGEKHLCVEAFMLAERERV